jgi:hypothetical protein
LRLAGERRFPFYAFGDVAGDLRKAPQIALIVADRRY